MERLTGEAGMSRSFAAANVGNSTSFGSQSRDVRVKTVYATTPAKRKRIF